MNPLQPRSFESNFTALAARCGLQVTRTSAQTLMFASSSATSPMEGTVAAITRNRYKGDVRRRELLGFRVTMQRTVATGGRIVIAEQRLCSRLTRWLNRRAGLTRVSSPAPLAHLEIWTADRSWADSVLAISAICSRVLALIPPENGLRHAGLHWHPDRLVFAPSADSQTIVHAFEQWQQDLHALAELAAVESPPAEAYTPHWLETHSHWIPFVLLIGGVMLLGLMIPLSLALIFLLTYLKVF